MKHSYNLFYMSKSKGNGLVSYVCHLVKAFEYMGHEVNLYKIGNRTEKNTRSLFDNYFGVRYRNLSLQDALQMVSTDHSRNERSLIAAVTYSQYKKDPAFIRQLLEAGCEVVIHAPWDMPEAFADTVHSMGIRPIVIRESLRVSERFVRTDPVYIPHIYMPHASTQHPEFGNSRSTHSVSITRVYPDKNSEMILDSNLKLCDSEKIHIHGFVDPFYLYHKLRIKYDWDFDILKGTGTPQAFNIPYYQGLFPSGQAVPILSNYQFNIDLSSYPENDGGGSQYTFLESFDAGTPLIVHKDWLEMGSGAELVDDVNCIGVSTTEELMYLLNNLSIADVPDLIKTGKEILHLHSPEVVIPKFDEFFEDIRYE